MTTLYRLFAADSLLYVGIADHWTSRLRQHAGDKPWLETVDRVELAQYPSREDALRAERLAIIAEHPLHNVVHNSPRPPVMVAAVNRWTCEVCSQPVAKGEGYVTSVRRLDGLWRCFHRACDPYSGDTGYWIAVERILTEDEIQGWTEHLARKRWFDADEWDDLVQRCWTGRRKRPLSPPSELGTR